MCEGTTRTARGTFLFVDVVASISKIKLFAGRCWTTPGVFPRRNLTMVDLLAEKMLTLDYRIRL